MQAPVVSSSVSAISSQGDSFRLLSSCSPHPPIPPKKLYPIFPCTHTLSSIWFFTRDHAFNYFYFFWFLVYFSCDTVPSDVQSCSAHVMHSKEIYIFLYIARPAAPLLLLIIIVVLLLFRKIFMNCYGSLDLFSTS